VPVCTPNTELTVCTPAPDVCTPEVAAWLKGVMGIKAAPELTACTEEPELELDVKKAIVKSRRAADFTPPEHLADLWPDYIAMRNGLKRGKDTYHALELIVKKLYELSPSAETQRKILENSIVNRWMGVFPLKNMTSGGSRYGPQEVDKKEIYNNTVSVIKERHLKLEAQASLEAQGLTPEEAERKLDIMEFASWGAS